MVLPTDPFPGEVPEDVEPAPLGDSEWRTRDRIKTVSVALVLCMNIGIGPPDTANKPQECAKLHAWTDPFVQPTAKSLELIAKTLQTQYELWQPRARYRLALDPAIEEIKKLCHSLRRSAKEERVLFHYNGHGVPRPTASGEIWVFNKNYTQYIPVSMYDLQGWLGAPALFVYDCSAAGHILTAFQQFATQRDSEGADGRHAGGLSKSHETNLDLPALPNSMSALSLSETGSGLPLTSATFGDCIQLAACQANETLPWNPDLPADLFTSCLTTPIPMALRWHVLKHTLFQSKISLPMTLKMPGRLNDRRTPLGELNWIFTAVTDTIAWSVLPREMFRRLFRQDLMVAALFRNFLLAQRILKSYGCHPMASPALPETDLHELWDAWDMVVDLCLDQLPTLLTLEKTGDYVHSTFFAEQLTAFDIWLTQGSLTQKAPLQLPIVLQVLLSQHHRLRALIILSRFLDLGPWAVQEALHVGIFPYVLKLLQSPAPELKPVLVFIWTRILAVDPSCQADLLKDNAFSYFLHVLSPTANLVAVQDVSEHRAMCAFILATLCHGFPAGQLACLQHSVIPLCLLYLHDHDDLLRQWSCICIAQVAHQCPEAILAALQEGAHVKIARVLVDTVAEVRAAAALALGTFLQLSSPQLHPISLEIIMALLPGMSDASCAVRVEVVIAFACFVTHHKKQFEERLDQLIDQQASAPIETKTKSRLAALVAVPDTSTFQSLTDAVLKLLLMASMDPEKKVAQMACKIIDAVLSKTDLYPPCSTLFSVRRKYFSEPQIQVCILSCP
jgi:regulator-associated protein of mTOR